MAGESDEPRPFVRLPVIASCCLMEKLSQAINPIGWNPWASMLLRINEWKRAVGKLWHAFFYPNRPLGSGEIVRFAMRQASRLAGGMAGYVGGVRIMMRKKRARSQKPRLRNRKRTRRIL